MEQIVEVSNNAIAGPHAAIVAPDGSVLGLQTKRMKAMGAAPGLGYDTGKSNLVCSCLRILKRNVTKQELLYETKKVQGGFQSEVTVSCFSEMWGVRTFVGGVAPSEKQAEHSVAGVALDAILANPELKAEHEKKGKNVETNARRKYKKEAKGEGKVEGMAPDPTAFTELGGGSGRKGKKGKDKGKGKGKVDPFTQGVLDPFAGGGMGAPNPFEAGFAAAQAGQPFDPIAMMGQIQNAMMQQNAGAVVVPPPTKAIQSYQPRITAKDKLRAACSACVEREVQDHVDIVYSTSEALGGKFQCTVTMACIDGEFGTYPFTGAMKKGEAEAEESAADVALESLRDDDTYGPKAMAAVDALEEPPRKRHKAGHDALAPIPLQPAAVDHTSKLALNGACMKLVKRKLNKGEIMYDTKQVVGGFQSEVTISCLADTWGIRTYVGSVMDTQKDAEHAAAKVALDSVTQQFGSQMS
eukprot:gnl/MRDRNA2_/MRDRNA2_60793_c0_seq1.p1 gnl/MRDRNA2_/MRDRNA2_60793_c0~~gnl/MRDRNA2_/MRDRNA2_60793_c0_seq1.p1  ORF type:complete len:468 (-),score=98.21 gnl/MRDRNA2_/MRDRNA2_60793_c0_seq1:113-1516(-)